MSFWPDDIFIDDIQSPLEIMEDAKKEWENLGGGVLDLIVNKTDNDSQTLIEVYARNKSKGRTLELFTLVSEKGENYPILINIESNELPNYLKKEYKMTSSIATALSLNQDKLVTNKWVSDTPTEFRGKLTDAFNESAIKRKILNLISQDEEKEQKQDE